jgi:hypothetical protein
LEVVLLTIIVARAKLIKNVKSDVDNVKLC